MYIFYTIFSALWLGGVIGPEKTSKIPKMETE
jgi:hypothetical protein